MSLICRCVLSRQFFSNKFIKISHVSKNPTYRQILSQNLWIIVAISLENYDNAEDFVKISLLKQKFRSASLPSSRQEFESRAVLYEIVNELREMLILKRDFTKNLSPHQIEMFWTKK